SPRYYPRPVPTRRSSDLLIIHADTESAEFMQSDLGDLDVGQAHYFPETGKHPYNDQQITDSSVVVQRSEVLENIRRQTRRVMVRSEEHTSELQSRFDLVC